MPLEDGDRIVALENWDTEANNESRQSIHDFMMWREEMTSVVDIGAFRTVSRNFILPNTAAVPSRIAEITAAGFGVARVQPLLGQPLVAHHERPGAAPVVVIGHDIWQDRFDGAPDVIGREVQLGKTTHTVIGVMPEGFAFPMNHDLWTPFSVTLSAFDRGEGPEVFVFGRLTDNATREQAQAELTALGHRSVAESPQTHERLRPQVLPYTYPLVDIQDVSAWWVHLTQMFVSLVLVVVAVNVAVLAYARTATRRAEIAVRCALGANRRRIVTQLFVEALVLALLSAAVGLVLARVGLRQANLIMEQEVVSVPFWTDYSLSFSTMLYVVGLAVFAAVIVGVVPALQSTGRRLRSNLGLLKGGGSGPGLGVTWTVLIVAQVAVAVFALPAAVGAGWTQIQHATTRPTFPADQILAGRLTIDEEEQAPDTNLDEYRSGLTDQYTALQTELISMIKAEPGLSHVAYATSFPGYEPRRTIELDREPDGVEREDNRQARINRVDLDFFETFDAQLVAGRRFNRGDLDAQAPAVVVNRSFVDNILGGSRALGLRVRFDEERVDGGNEVPNAFEIVGVINNLHSNPFDAQVVEPTIYRPLAPGPAYGAVLIAVRVRRGGTATVAGRLREMTTSLDPTLRLAGTSSLTAIDRQAQVALRLVALVLGFIILSVVLLSAGGIYALMSFTVTQRRREIGIRTALGAHRLTILRSIFSRALRQLAVGVAIGVTSAALFDWNSGGELMAGKGPVLLPVMALGMMTVGLVAALGPARRGLRIQPTEALRDAD